MKTNTINKTIHCPRCRCETTFSAANPYRPFCSQRCQTMDLGAWAEESYRIPLSPRQIESESFAESFTESFNEGSTAPSMDDENSFF